MRQSKSKKRFEKRFRNFRAKTKKYLYGGGCTCGAQGSPPC